MAEKQTHILPEQVILVPVATAEEKPGLPKCDLRVLLPLPLSKSQTRVVSGQSIPTDNQTRWRREERESFLTAEVKQE